MGKKLIIAASIIIAVIIVAELGYRYWASQQVTTVDENIDPSAEFESPILEQPAVTVEGTPDAVATEEAIEAALKEQLAAESEAMIDQGRFANITFDGDATQPLAIGSPDAPVTIIEYSSLSCPHCAFFHKTTLPDIVKNYVNTGKVRIVFQDFPLNKKAFDASMVGRCMPGDQRYAFMNLLFATMNDWLAADDHVQALSQYAVIEGMDNEALAECMNRQDVAEAVIEGAREGSETYNVTSTPTFVINGGKITLSGSLPYSEFSRQIDSLLAE